MNHRQAPTVATIGAGPRLVLNLMSQGIRRPAAFLNSILRHGRVPYQIALGSVVISACAYCGYGVLGAMTAGGVLPLPPA